MVNINLTYGLSRVAVFSRMVSGAAATYCTLEASVRMMLMRMALVRVLRSGFIVL